MKLNTEIIKSTTNAKVCEVKKLLDKKYRKQAEQFICEGVNILCDIPSGVEISSVFLTTKAEADERIANWLTKIKLDYLLVSDEVMAVMSDTPSPSGALCVLPNLSKKPLTSPRVLVLDGMKDPGNLGTIIRTAAACGYNDIITVDCAEIYNPKVIRSTMSGIFRVNIVDIAKENVKNILHGYELFALDMCGDNIFKYLETNKLRDKFAVIIGSEAQGLSDELRSAATKTLSLPMENNVESLNAAVTAGIVCYILMSRQSMPPDENINIFRRLK